MRIIALVTLLFSCTILKAQVKFNGNFEQLNKTGMPQGWDITFDNQNTYEVKLDSLVKVQGKYSLSLASGNSRASFGAINFPINQRLHGKTIILAGSIKTENVSGWAGLWLRVDGKDQKILAFDNMESKGIKGTTPWREYYVEVPYDEGEALTLNAGVLLAGKGKIWADSLRLYMDDMPIDQAPINTGQVYAALNDTAFSKKSGVDTVILNKQNINYLTLLGQLWGFLKYHHPAIANGDYNWDAQLFRILPKVLDCRTTTQFSAVMEKWVDDLGKPKPCTDCTPLAQIKNIAIRPDYGSLFTNQVFSKSLTGKLKYILNNSNNSTNYYVDIKGTTGVNPEFKHENTYDAIKYPDAGYRLLALYRYWNMIQYFSPNRNLITEDWNQVLTAYIPQFIGANNQFAYLKTMVKLISNTHDTHAFIVNDVYGNHSGNYQPPFQAKFIEDKLVVTGFYKDTLQVKDNFKLGDIITAINGVKVDELVKKYVPVTSASNTDAALRDMPNTYLLKNTNPRFSFSVIRDNQQITVVQQAAETAKINSYGYDWGSGNNTPGYLLKNQIGYIYPGKYKSTDIDSVKKYFTNTKGIIVDMRCYPSADMIQYFGNFIKPDSSEFIKFTHASLNHPGMFVYFSGSKTGNRTHNYYRGKVVVIVNATTQSNAEFVTMAFQTSPNVTVIGSTTAGADGNISVAPLPGISTWFSGLGVYYPDGTNAQRAGVKIDQVIKPTIQGIKNGRDELMEKAEQIIMGNQ